MEGLEKHGRWRYHVFVFVLREEMEYDTIDDLSLPPLI